MSTIDENPIKCSAVSTMERSMPDFDYSHLIKELRELIITDIEANPGKYSPEDIKKAYHDDWFIARYLLRMKLDVKSSHQMLRKALEFRNSPIVSFKQFPNEFYEIGAIFQYEPDRKGNIPVYMRIRVIEEADKQAQGKGIVLVFDLQSAGLSYMLVHELHWTLRSCWHIAKQWLSEDHKDLVKFSDSQTIYEYFKRENLPDFIGGTCQRDYRAIAKNSITIPQAAKLYNINEEELYRLRKKFADFLPPNK